MKCSVSGLILLSGLVSGCTHQIHYSGNPVLGLAQQAQNPVIFADVPDMSMIRVGDTYYMSSTTMHMAPGVPIMKSTDLVNWQIVNYAYEILGDVDELNLNNGKNSYGRGSWASSIRFHNGTFYVSTFAQTTGKTYIYSTRDIERGPWKESSFSPSFHDNTLFFDDDGRIYLIYGNKKLTLVELNNDLSGVKSGGINQIIIENSVPLRGMIADWVKVPSCSRLTESIIFSTSPGQKAA